LIGFCGSPWTLAAYMVEGKSVPGFPAVREMMEKSPVLLHHLLDLLAKSVAAHLAAQIEAGAQVVMLFDTWGGLLETEDYFNFSLHYLKQAIRDLKEHYNTNIPVILFTKGGGRWLEEIAASGCEAIGVDWTVSLKSAREQVGLRVALQGNMNPACLLESPEAIRKEAANILQAYGRGSGHVFNLGHGITPDVPPEHVSVLVDAVHELSQAYHAA